MEPTTQAASDNGQERPHPLVPPVVSGRPAISRFAEIGNAGEITSGIPRCATRRNVSAQRHDVAGGTCLHQGTQRCFVGCGSDSSNPWRRHDRCTRIILAEWSEIAEIGACQRQPASTTGIAQEGWQLGQGDWFGNQGHGPRPTDSDRTASGRTACRLCIVQPASVEPDLRPLRVFCRCQGTFQIPDMPAAQMASQVIRLTGTHGREAPRRS